MVTHRALNEVTDNVILGEGTIVEPPCLLGKPPAGGGASHLVTRIGADSVIRPFTTIHAGVVAGDRLQTGQSVTIREDNVIGDDVSIGTLAALERSNRIGNRVRIHTGCGMERATIEDDAWIGPYVVLTDDPHPPCPEYEDCVGGVVIRSGARIGAHATVLPGVEIGAGAVVGAASVVTRDVPPGTVAVGNPAKVIGEVSDQKCRKGGKVVDHIALIEAGT